MSKNCVKTGEIRKGLFFAGILMMALVLLCLPARADEPALSRGKVTLQVHNAFVLRLKNPQAMGPVKWRNSNQSVLSVVYYNTSRIVVRAERPGTAKIRCIVGGKKLVCRFTVKNSKGIPKKMTVIEGDRVKFRYSSTPGLWSSSDESIAPITGRKKIRSKMVRFNDVGKVVITEKIWRKKYRCQVTVLTKDGYKSRQAAEQALYKNIEGVGAQIREQKERHPQMRDHQAPHQDRDAESPFLCTAFHPAPFLSIFCIVMLRSKERRITSFLGKDLHRCSR